MKKKLEFIPLVLFVITAILSVFIDNTEAALGFLVASMTQIRIIILLNKFDEGEEEK